MFALVMPAAARSSTLEVQPAAGELTTAPWTTPYRADKRPFGADAVTPLCYTGSAARRAFSTLFPAG